MGACPDWQSLAQNHLHTITAFLLQCLLLWQMLLCWWLQIWRHRDNTSMCTGRIPRTELLAISRTQVCVELNRTSGNWNHLAGCRATDTLTFPWSVASSAGRREAKRGIGWTDDCVWAFLGLVGTSTVAALNNPVYNRLSFQVGILNLVCDQWNCHSPRLVVFPICIY